MTYPVIKWIPYYEPYYTDANGRRREASEPEGTVIDAAFAPETTSESASAGGAQRIISEAKLYLRKPIKYSQRDFFRIDGVLHQAVGQNPGWYGRYSRQLFGQEILLKRVGE